MGRQLFGGGGGGVIFDSVWVDEKETVVDDRVRRPICIIEQTWRWKDAHKTLLMRKGEGGKVRLGKDEGGGRIWFGPGVSK